MPMHTRTERGFPAGAAGLAFLGVLLVSALVVGMVLLGTSEDLGAEPEAAADATVASAGEVAPAAAAGSTDAPSAAAQEPAPEPAPTPDPAPEPAPTQEPVRQGPPVTLAFAGDVMFEGMLRPQLDADPDALLTPIAPVLGAADLAVVNLETAITTGGRAVPKQYVFRAPATGLQALRAAGVDAASLANNHGMDFGEQGLLDTLDAAAGTGVPIIGAGHSLDEAYAPLVTTIRGWTVAIIAATDVMDSAFLETWPATATRPGLASTKSPHEARLLEAVAEARAAADTVVVYLHWGVEGQHCPSERQQTLARRLVQEGADVIVGGHAHRLQGAGRLDDALVAYGLGNFVFYARGGAAAETGVLTVTVEGRDVLDYEWIPARLRRGVPHPLEGAEAAQALQAWHELRGCTDLAS